jgi:nucleoid DNA-binding protein
MTTGDLVDRLAKNWELEPEETRKVLDAAVQNMCDQLAQGNDFSIPGLGTFRTTTVEKERIYDSEKNLYKMMPPRRVITFESKSASDSGQEDSEAGHE